MRIHLSKVYTHTYLFNGRFPGLPGSASTRKVKLIWILLKQETVSGSGISWTICKSAPRSRQITMPAPHHLVFYRPDALPAAQPTASKHWRTEQKYQKYLEQIMYMLQGFERETTPRQLVYTAQKFNYLWHSKQANLYQHKRAWSINFFNLCHHKKI